MPCLVQVILEQQSMEDSLQQLEGQLRDKREPFALALSRYRTRATKPASERTRYKKNMNNRTYQDYNLRQEQLISKCDYLGFIIIKIRSMSRKPLKWLHYLTFQVPSPLDVSGGTIVSIEFTRHFSAPWTP